MTEDGVDISDSDFTNNANGVYVAGNGADISDCELTDNTNGIFLSSAGSSGSEVTIKNNNISNGSDGIEVGSGSHVEITNQNTITGASNMGIEVHSDNVKIDNNEVSGSGFAGVYMRYGDGEIEDNDLINNGYGIYMESSGGSDFNDHVQINHNEITGNSSDGAQILDSYARLQENLITDNGDDGVHVWANSHVIMWEGYNKVVDNDDDEVTLSSSSARIKVGFWANPGNNAIYDNAYPSGGAYISNAAMTSDGETQWTVPAKKSYWNGTPQSGMFDGPVNTNGYLSSDPTTGYVPSQSIQQNSNQEVVAMSVMSAGATRSITQSVDPQRRDKALTLKERMMDVRNKIARYPDSSRVGRWLNTLYGLQLSDPKNALGERTNTMALIAQDRMAYAAVRQQGAPSVGEEESRLRHAKRIRGGMAVILEIEDRLRYGTPAQALSLAEQYAGYITNRDHQAQWHQLRALALMRQERNAEAIAEIEQAEKIKPTKRVLERKSGYTLPEYGELKEIMRQPWKDEVETQAPSKG